MSDIYEINLWSVGNPDHGQFAMVSDPSKVKAETLHGIQAAARAYIEEWDLGGGNWTSPPVRLNGKIIGHLSYNGRLWDKQGVEVVIPAKHTCDGCGEEVQHG